MKVIAILIIIFALVVLFIAINAILNKDNHGENVATPQINTKEYARIKIDDYTSNSELSACIPQKVFVSMMASKIKGEEYIYIHKTTLRRIEEDYAINQSKK